MVWLGRKPKLKFRIGGWNPVKFLICAWWIVTLRKCGDSALPNLVGRTFDLKSAYKQFGVDVEHQKTLRIAQRHPDGGVKFFAVQSLPFGATACVSSSCA